MDKQKFPKEWRQIIKESRIPLHKVAELIEMDFKKFNNMYYGLIYVPEVVWVNLEFLVKRIEGGEFTDLQKAPREYNSVKRKLSKPKVGFTNTALKGRVSTIVCNVCEKPFVPYGDLIPICKRCFEMKDAIRKRMILLKQGSLPQKSHEQRSALYWEYQ